MFDVLEQKVKPVTSMVNLHNLTKFCLNLQQSFMESMNSKKEIVNSITESSSLKNEKISVQQSPISKNVKTFAEFIHLIDITLDITQLTSADFFLKKLATFKFS